MKSLFFFFLLSAMLLAASTSTATTYYVNGTTGIDTWDGKTPAWDGTHGPKKTIQAGINAASAGDTVTVANGIYAGTGNKDLDFIGKAITVKSTNGAANCTIDCQNSGRGFYFHTNETNASIVQGFTIINGNVSGTWPLDCGGAINCQDSSPTITDCVLKNNYSSNYGGAVYTSSNSNIVLSNSTITENRAKNGAGINLFGPSTPRIEGCQIIWNWAGETAAGVYCNTDAVIINCDISYNRCSPGGSSRAAGLYLHQFCPSVTGCRIIENRSDTAAGIFCSHTTAIISNSSINGNVGFKFGGGLYCTDRANLSVTNCEIKRNFAHDGGPAIRCTENSNPEFFNCIITENGSDGSSTGISAFKSLPKFYNCAVLRNTGHMNSSYIYSGAEAIITMTNCIMRNNGDNLITEAYGGIVEITFSNVQGGYEGLGNIDADPRFVNEKGENYHLLFDSPCIDAGTSDGTPVTDREGVARWDYSVVPNTGGGAIPYYDMGVFELVDSDLDSLPDYWETTNGLNPNDDGTIDPNNGSSGDPDSDSLSNLGEFLNSCNPHIADTDSDGRNDFSEIATSTNPAHPDNVQKTYYVNYSSANDVYDGLSSTWNGIHGPKKTIQGGILATIDGWNYVVEVAPGTYPVGGTKTLDFEGKAITVKSKKGASLTVIDCENNGRAFKFHSREQRDSVVDGFKIINGFTDVEGYQEHALGGAIFSKGSSPTIRNCIFLDNNSNEGGAISSFYAELLISGCTFINNSANFGGAIQFAHSYGTIENSVISDNYVVIGNGGGIDGNESNMVLRGCTISGNIAVYDGGGAYILGSGEVSDCIITGNQARIGGGLLNQNGNISNCRITNNTATMNGGGISGNSQTIRDCIVRNNTATGNGGGIYAGAGEISRCTVMDNSSGSSGGGIYGSASLFNCLIATNEAAEGGGYHGGGSYIRNCTFFGNTASSTTGGFYCTKTNFQISNCIFWNNSPTEIHPNVSLTVSFSDVKGGWSGTGNLDQDPLFTHGPLHNFYLSHIAAGQSEDSPCIDAGSAASSEIGLDNLTTRTDSISDSETVDMGYHSPYALYAFSIIQIGSDIRIRWSANPGVSYVVEWSDDMASWTKVPVGQVSEWTDTNTGDCEKRFYRVREE